jgi:hypothetical protein
MLTAVRWIDLHPISAAKGNTVSKIQRLLLTLCVLGAAGSLAGFATFSAFSSTTSNTGNTFATGSVTLSDNDAGSAMYGVSNAGPGSSVQKCIKVTYTGSMPADVRLYTPSTLGAGANYIDLTVEQGTGNPSFPGCTGFSAGSTLYSGTLGGFASAKNSYANGVATYPASQSQWNQNDAVVYRFTLTVEDTNSAQGQTIGSHDFTWEARNQ